MTPQIPISWCTSPVESSPLEYGSYDYDGIVTPLIWLCHIKLHQSQLNGQILLLVLGELPYCGEGHMSGNGGQPL